MFGSCEDFVFPVDAAPGGPLFRDHSPAPTAHEQGDTMQKGSADTTRNQTVADVQFAGRRTGKIDWRSRPAAELRPHTAPAESVQQRIKHGLLLDGIG
jgi:hypothetical protein